MGHDVMRSKWMQQNATGHNGTQQNTKRRNTFMIDIAIAWH